MDSVDLGVGNLSVTYANTANNADLRGGSWGPLPITAALCSDNTTILKAGHYKFVTLPITYHGPAYPSRPTKLMVVISPCGG